MTPLRVLAATLALSATSLTAPAFADANRSSIEIEFQNQHDRIEQGIRTRQLTRHEANVLRTEQDRIAKMIARARIDGRIDPYEHREIQQAQAIASRHIRAEKHDRDTRVVADAPVRSGYGYWHRPRWWN
jgi:uncharacterized membrane protein YebE (DUF533 family)